MTINIVDIVEYLYKGEISKGNVTFKQESVESGVEIVTWNIDGVPRPTEQELIDYAEANNQAISLWKNFNDAIPLIQSVIDECAKEKQYQDGISCASYVTSTNPVWQAQAVAFITWRDEVWTYSYAEFSKMQQGQRSIPNSLDEFLTELPAMVWP